MTKLLTMSMALLLAAGVVAAAGMPTGKTHTNSLGMKLALIPAGEFVMGSPDSDEIALDREKPQHEVDLPAFRIGKYPVTNGQFGAFVEAIICDQDPGKEC